MTEIKDNSITVLADVLSSTEKITKDGQVIEVKVQIRSDELEGERDAFAAVLDGASTITFTPNQTELDTDGDGGETEGQTELEVD
ncbi:hypothetical protein [Levilactobacillus brevis]|uniref:hypothetical protein n=1 Tax=Levilactobacillus brevis TaxID=1580 RepID=UPI0032614C27